MPNEKARQRHLVAMEFGVLISPIADLARRDVPPALAEYRLAVAKAGGTNDANWRRTVREFATLAPDIFMAPECNRIEHVNERLGRAVQDIIDQVMRGVEADRAFADFKAVVERHVDMLSDYCDAIPLQWEPVLFAANTPFTAYMAIRDSMQVARRRLHYFDRYLKADFFPLFLREIGRGVQVRLITSAAGVRQVLAVSDLARQEFTDYQLVEVVPAQVHDRNLRVDDQVFNLGPGVDRAGIALTNFGPADSSPAAQASFDQIIAGGTVIHQSA